ncbi:hypothetical protein [Enterococcus alishanensis]
MRKGKQVWAVVCGAVRDELELRLTLNELLQLREAGVIEGIIISTWINEFNQLTDLRNEIEENNIEVIEQPPLESRMNISKSNSVNYFRQALQMQVALDKLPEDCFVLKARTDRSLNHLKMIRPYLDKPLNKIKYPTKREIFGQKLPKIFDYPIVIFNAKTQRILHFSDFVFLGHKKDIRTLINFDLPELYLGRDLVANTQWFVYPFLKNFPVIRDYFRLINFRPLIKDMKKQIETDLFLDLLPTFFYRAYGTYLMILNYYFELVPLVDCQFDVMNYNFNDLFTDSREKGVSFTNLGSALQSNQVVQNFLSEENFEHQKSTGYFFDILKNQDITKACSNEEYLELNNFKETGWFKNKHWLREKNWQEKVENQKNIYKKNMRVYSFQELNLVETELLLKELETSENSDRTLYNYWLNNSKLGALSAEQMVLPFARTQNQDSVMLVSRLLRMNLMKNEQNKKNMQHLIEVVSNVQLQRGTANIKTVQMMLNLLLFQKNDFESIYDDVKGKIVLRKYLTEEEFKVVITNKYSQEQLVKYLLDLANHYEHIGKKVLALRLNELAAEIKLSKNSVEKIATIYEYTDNHRNYLLAKKTMTFFDKH